MKNKKSLAPSFLEESYAFLKIFFNSTSETLKDNHSKKIFQVEKAKIYTQFNLIIIHL